MEGKKTGLGRALMVVLAWALVLAAPTPALATGRCGGHPWCDTALSPDGRADLLLGAMSQSDKVAMLTGGGAPDVDVPKLGFVDGPLGAGADGALSGESVSATATAMPAGIALAAAWDPTLAQRYGAVIGAEVAHRGFDGVDGPDMNIMRTPLGGRTFESFGEDPLLASRAAVGWIQGAQAQGVMADAKHYAENGQEGRFGASPLAGAQGGRVLVNALVDDRTLHEIELAPFDASVHQGNVATVMCAYNQVNGVYACDNRDLLQRVLRGELGFHWMILSDLGAAKTPAADLGAGLNWDIVGNSDNPPLVDASLATGQVSPQTLDARVQEYLRTLFAYGFFDRAPYTFDPSRDDQATDLGVAQQTAEQGATLLKNDGVLPIDPARVRSLAVIGAPAAKYIHGFGSSEVNPSARITALQGLSARAAQAGVKLTYDDGSDLSRAAAVARSADAAIVFAADSAGEGNDKLCLDLQPGCAPSQQSAVPNQVDPSAVQSAFGDQDGLIRSVAAANPRTVVTLETGAPVLTPWRDKVAGLLEAWYPGQQGGSAIARVLFGDAQPAGRLPVSFPAFATDVPTGQDPSAYPGVFNPSTGVYDETYREGVMVGYRGYDANRLTPAFPFGFGLSYTSFRLSRLRIAPASAASGHLDEVRATVTNTGHRGGTAIPELYLGLASPPGVPEPPRQLAGFSKVTLAPGQSTTVTMPLDARAFSYWDSAARAWRVAPGCDAVSVGSSSRDLPLTGTIAQGGARCLAPASRCPRSRTLHFNIHQNNGRAVRVVVSLGHRRLKLVRGRRITRVSIRRPAGKSFVIRVTVTTASRVTVTSVHRYRACTPTRRRTRSRAGPRRRRHHAV